MPEKTAEKRKKKVRMVSVTAILLLLGIFLASRALRSPEKNAVTAQERLAYLASLGWEVDPSSEEIQSVTIPDCSEGAMASYNELLKRGGFDLSPYQGRTVDLYCYRLLNYPGAEETVYLALYVSDGRVIGGDIHTAALDGFMHELRARE